VSTSRKPGRRAGKPSGKAERPAYVTHEQQLRALLEHMRHRDRRLARAIRLTLSAEPQALAAFGEVMEFVADEARREARARGGR